MKKIKIWRKKLMNLKEDMKNLKNKIRYFKVILRVW